LLGSWSAGLFHLHGKRGSGIILLCKIPDLRQRRSRKCIKGTITAVAQIGQTFCLHDSGSISLLHIRRYEQKYIPRVVQDKICNVIPSWSVKRKT
jgi:hypothetical protein